MLLLIDIQHTDHQRISSNGRENNDSELDIDSGDQDVTVTA